MRLKKEVFIMVELHTILFLAACFFKGGVLHYKDGLPEPFRERATMYLKSIMGSFAPKHEHKEAVCALILSELVDIKAYEQ
jgi:hypothetical protein